MQQEIELRERQRRQAEEEEKRKADAEQKRNSSLLQVTSLDQLDYSLYHSSHEPHFVFPPQVRPSLLVRGLKCPELQEQCI